MDTTTDKHSGTKTKLGNARDVRQVDKKGKQRKKHRRIQILIKKDEKAEKRPEAEKPRRV